MDKQKTPRIQHVGYAVITGMLALGVAAMFGVKMAHPSVAPILAFFLAAWGVIYIVGDWFFVTRPQQVKKNVPIPGAELRLRQKRFFDNLPRS